MRTRNTEEIAGILIQRSLELFRSPRSMIRYTGSHPADALLNDLENYPHAFVLACVMDRQMKAELAWMIPYRFVEILGDFEFSTLERLSRARIEEIMTQPEPLHRFPVVMAENFFRAVELIGERYSGDASLIWTGGVSSATVVFRFLEFRGVGPKIATMAANILARDYKVPFSDHYSIDVSPDVQVRRVFARLGLTPPQPTNEQLIYCARALHPEFPGLLDLPAWEIGRTWCRPQAPDCPSCYMYGICPSSSEDRPV